MMLISKYGDKENFLSTYNPSYQRKICAKAEECYFGDYPTLTKLKGYGENVPTAWLIPQLYNLSEYCGCKDKLQGNQLEECAFVIATEFHYLKISEIMLFMHRFKSGRYGRFYGAVDPFVIVTSLREFLKERSYDYEKHEQQLNFLRMEESSKKAITYEEHIRRERENASSNN